MDEPNCRVVSAEEAGLIRAQSYMEFVQRLDGSGLMVDPFYANKWWGVFPSTEGVVDGSASAQSRVDRSR